MSFDLSAVIVRCPCEPLLISFCGMQGETNLKTLLRNMRPIVDEREFVFCSIDAATLSQLSIKPIGVFSESEGTTLVLDKKQADKYSLAYGPIWSLITLTIHSDLAAVGFLAAVTGELLSRLSSES